MGLTPRRHFIYTKAFRSLCATLACVDAVEAEDGIEVGVGTVQPHSLLTALHLPAQRLLIAHVS